MLGTFSGLYDLSAGNSLFSQQRVEYLERRSQKLGVGQPKFAYCHSISAWTFRYSGSDPCDWVARSSTTDTFDLIDTSSLWYARDKDNREVALEPFYLACFDCDSSEECGGHGSCENAACRCRNKAYGLRCEFSAPCARLSVDSSREEFVTTRDWATSYSQFSVGGEMVEAYNRPVYIYDYGEGDFDILVFTGRRWGLTSSGKPHAS